MTYEHCLIPIDKFRRYLRAKCGQCAKETGIADRVVFHDMVHPSLVAKYNSVFDLFLATFLPDIREEVRSVRAREYMGGGRPVLASMSEDPILRYAITFPPGSM